MGTNFYLFTTDKETKNKFFNYGEFEIVDEPTFGYSIHIAKTSYGWLPLFQSHTNIHSVKDLENVYKYGNFTIYDEYDIEYTWDEFVKRVIHFNGGVAGAIKRKKTSPHDDKYEYVPISHFEYDNGKYAHYYTKDSDGYEFMSGDFC